MSSDAFPRLVAANGNSYPVTPSLKPVSNGSTAASHSNGAVSNGGTATSHSDGAAPAGRSAVVGKINDYCHAMGGHRPIRSVLIANNGIAAVKCIRSIRSGTCLNQVASDSRIRFAAHKFHWINEGVYQARNDKLHEMRNF